MSESEGEFTFIAPATVRIKFHGKITEAQARSLLGRAAEHATGLPYILMEVDISDMGGATPESRRVSAEILRSMPRRIIAVFGGSFTQGIVAKLVLKATEMLSGGQQVSGIFDNHAEATAWLKQKAEQIEAKRDS